MDLYETPQAECLEESMPETWLSFDEWQVRFAWSKTIYSFVDDVHSEKWTFHWKLNGSQSIIFANVGATVEAQLKSITMR